MSTTVIQADAPAAAGGTGANPWLIAILVALASFMEVLDTTIANVALPYIAGGMGVSEDEASWVVTTYLVSNAIILTASSFLARMLGRKTFFLICLGLFSVSSVLCAQAWNLDALLMFRILQGLAALRRRERIRQDRLCNRHHAAAAEPLQDTEQQQRVQIRGEPAQQRAQGE